MNGPTTEPVPRQRDAQPPDPAVDLSVVIVSWNTAELLERCLASLEQEFQRIGGLRSQVIVVDNGSSDGTPERIRARYPWVEMRVNATNMGFAAANNLGLRDSRGRYILLLNPDTEVLPGALATLMAYMDDHPEVGLVGPRLLNPDGTLQVSCYPSPTLSRELWRLLHLDRWHPYGTYRMESWSTELPRQVEVIKGACMLVRRDALEQVGPLDESYFMYTEEVDWCYRIRRAGWTVVWVPQARVLHYGGQSTQQIPEEMFLHLYRSKVQYFRKHYGRWGCRGYKAILLLASGLRIVGIPLARLVGVAPGPEALRLARNYMTLVRMLPDL